MCLPAFAMLLKRYRGRARLTQERLAERASLSIQAISALERGVHARPRVETVYALAGALHLAPQEALLFERAAFQPDRHQSGLTGRGDAVVDGVLVALADHRARASMPAIAQALAQAFLAAPGVAD